MKPKHTPTPWAHDKNQPNHIVADKNDYSVLIAKTNFVDLGSDDLPAVANAAHIVHAVNILPELIEVLEEALSTVRTHAMQTYSKVSKEQAVNLEALINRAKSGSIKPKGE